uniref:Pyruvate kinase n=1 Tax=Heligmosomoides polygyrus TaxID=6339 RepID=A0A8L8JUP5_HELPZ
LQGHNCSWAANGSVSAVLFQYHGGTIVNVRQAVEQMGGNLQIGIALDTKGPEIRTGLLVGGATAEVGTRGDRCRALVEEGVHCHNCSWAANGSVSAVLFQYHGGTIVNVRQAVEQMGGNLQIGIALDTKGPEIRTGLLVGGATAEVELVKGKSITLTTDDQYKEKCTAEMLYLDYKNIVKVVSKGSRVYVDDGLISLVVNEIKEPTITCTIENGGMLGEDLKFGVEQGVDMIFASFIRNADGVRTMRKVLGEKGKNIKIIAKIENQEGMEKADEIIQEADGVMVARGDLGIEIPTEKVFVAQKMLLAKCNRAGKPCVCATQMLESMTKKPRPTRAEAGDVANAVRYHFAFQVPALARSVVIITETEDRKEFSVKVLDGADCVMLSGESAKGDYPLETVKTMHFICREAEAATDYDELLNDLLANTNRPVDMTNAAVMAAVISAVNCHASAIVLTTSSGRTAFAIARYKPPMPVFAVCRNANVCRQLNIARSVFPVFYNKPKQSDFHADVDSRVNHGIEYGKEKGYINKGDFIVVVQGWKFGQFFEEHQTPWGSILVEPRGGAGQELGWTKIKQPPYAPDIAPSDCHLLRSMDHFLYGRHFTEIDEVTVVVHDFIRSKPTKFYRDVNHSLREKRKKVIKSNGNNFV